MTAKISSSRFKVNASRLHVWCFVTRSGSGSWTKETFASSGKTITSVTGGLMKSKKVGWQELESVRSLFNSPYLYPGLREYLLVDDKCVSVLTDQPPEILDLGEDPVNI